MTGEKGKRRKICAYRHSNKARLNNPEVGLVNAKTDKDGPKKTYNYDPHLDPALQWAGKDEHTSFQVPSVSLHVHERIDPYTIIQAIKNNPEQQDQISLFEQQDFPLREAIEFYKHSAGWSNRLVAGDSLLVMNSLLEKEGMANQVQMIYMDPPYGITYGSNFQPFINKTTIKDKNDSDLSVEPETLKAFRDTWELGVHSYLTYMRDRLLLVKELLHESGSCFVQISDENVHHIREVMDEIFGPENFFSLISFFTTPGLGSKGLNKSVDYLVWYCKNKEKIKYRNVYISKDIGSGAGANYNQVELSDGIRRSLSNAEKKNPNLIPAGSRLYYRDNLTSGAYRKNTTIDYVFQGKTYHPGPNRCWKTTKEGLDRLVELNRIEATNNSLYYVRFLDDFPVSEISNCWLDTSSSFMPDKIYAVQTSRKVIERCILLTTDPGDLVFDPTCGSGTTAVAAEHWGRRWITCDTSRVAIALAKQRIMTSKFDYYKLAHPKEGISSGFEYNTVPHITLSSLAKDESPIQETLYDQPIKDSSKIRITGPFTVEAVPAPIVESLDNLNTSTINGSSIARSGETLRQNEWQEELLKAGIRGRGGQRITFSRIETLAGMRYINADGETKESNPQRVVISFGPEHAPLEQRQVEMAIEEAMLLVPKPNIIVFAAFQFDPEAAKDIEEINWPGVVLLKVQMNADLYTEDLKKKRSSNESFWLVGQPDIELQKNENDTWQIHVLGFDYYNTVTGILDSGGSDKIAMWMLDTDYDGRSLYPKQVFFPLINEKIGWKKFAKNLKAEINQEKIEKYSGTKSFPFNLGEYKRIAVKIIDDRGIESLKIIKVS